MGHAIRVKTYDMEGGSFECWKLSSVEWRSTYRDEQICDYLAESLKYDPSLPRVFNKLTVDGAVVYVLLPLPTVWTGARRCCER